MPIHPPTPALFLTGPTGSGKSALAVALARHFPVEIVNGDAFQLYRGLETLTASPAAAERQVCPHHLYEILSPSETCDAARYLDLVQPVLADIQSRGHLAIVTGGSGMYLKALSHGLDDSVCPSPTIRAELDLLSLEQIRARLAAADPSSLDRIGPHNRRYLQRALEITLTAGRPASELRQAWSVDPPGLRGVYLDRPRDELNQRIATRSQAMLNNGALEEVAAIPSWSATSRQAIGVREIQAHLAGEIDFATCLERIQQATRRYAKRQITWFRRERWLLSLSPPPGAEWDHLIPEIRALLGR